MTLVFDSRRFQQFYQYAEVYGSVLAVMMNARNLLERLTGDELDDLITDEEVLRIQGKLRILGVPVNDNNQGVDS